MDENIGEEYDDEHVERRKDQYKQRWPFKTVFRSACLKYIENWQNSQFYIFHDSLGQNCDIPPSELMERDVTRVQLMEKLHKLIKWH